MHEQTAFDEFAPYGDPTPRAGSTAPAHPGDRGAAVGRPFAGAGDEWHLGGHPGDASDASAVDAGQASLWAVPWSDLMMVMFVLFASLLIMQRHHDAPAPAAAAVAAPVAEPEPRPEPVVEVEERAVERPAPGPTGGARLAPLTGLDVLGRSEAAVREAGIDNVEVALTGDDSVTVSVQGPMFFDLGKAELLPPVRDFLDRLAAVIAGTPFDIDVVGHTDDRPVRTDEFPSNWELSVVRAARVARYLIARSGVEPGRFTAIGRSMYEPAAPNLDDHTRAMNRRVEIIITRRQSTRPE